MFTDVVGFSKHSAINEERTFRALNRDFDIIYRQVSAHGGQVLNTMGDGMMIVFMSAISCIQCALAIQGEFHRQALSRPIDGILQHRIGLHIGDIILNGKNTMGDGVNQAARIESLARPDSIAMSSEFHAMVEGKTRFASKYVGTRIAKNIPEPIQIHEIPPIDEYLKEQTADALFSPVVEPSQGATGRRGALILVAVLLLIALAASPIFLLRSANDISKKERKIFAEGHISKTDAEKLRKKLANTNVAANNDTGSDSNNSANNAPDSGSITLTPDQLADIAAKTNAYDYAGAAAELRTAPGANSSDGMVMIKKYETLVQFKAWMDAQMTSTSETAPVDATVSGSPAKVFSTANGISIIINGQTTTRKLWEYDPATIRSIAEAISAKPPDSTIASPEASTWIGTFIEVHRLAQ